MAHTEKRILELKQSLAVALQKQKEEQEAVAEKNRKRIVAIVKAAKLDRFPAKVWKERVSQIEAVLSAAAVQKPTAVAAGEESANHGDAEQAAGQ